MLIVAETLSTFTVKEANINTTPAYSSKKVRLFSYIISTDNFARRYKYESDC